MRHFIVVLALIPAVLVVGYVLLSPAYLGDFRWIIIALPISLAAARELFDLAKGRTTESTRHLVHVTLTPIEEDDPEDDDTRDVDLESIAGLWTGTVNIWPGKPEEVLRVLSLHPGWVRTDMGGPNADVEVDASVAGLRRVIADPIAWPGGSFFDYRGQSLAW